MSDDRRQSDAKILESLAEDSKRPGWDPALTARIPDILLDAPPGLFSNEEKSPDKGLSQLIKDCRRIVGLSTKILFNGEPITKQLLPEDVIKANPDLKRIKEFLKEIDDLAKEHKDLRDPKDNNFIKFLNEKMTLQGLQTLLKWHDQTEIGAAAAFLMLAAKTVISTSTYVANYTFSKEKGLTLEVVSGGFVGAPSPDKKDAFFDDKTVLGSRFIVNPIGKVRRELYARPEDFPKIYLALLDTFLEKNIDELQKAKKPKEQLEAYKVQCEAYKILKGLLKNRPELSELFITNPNETANLIAMFCNIYSSILPEVSQSTILLQDKLKILEEKIGNMKDIKENDTKQFETIRGIFDEAISPEKLLKSMFELSKDPRQKNKDIAAATIEKTNAILKFCDQSIDNLNTQLAELKESQALSPLSPKGRA